MYTFTPGGSSPDLVMFFYANAKSWIIGHGFDGAYSHSCFWSNYQDQATPDQIPGKWVYGPDYSSSACESAWGEDMKSSCFTPPPNPGMCTGCAGTSVGHCRGLNGVCYDYNPLGSTTCPAGTTQCH